MTHLAAAAAAPRITVPGGPTHHPDGTVEFTFSSELEARYHPTEQVLWTRTTPKGIPCFTLDLLQEMERTSDAVEGYFGESPDERPLRYIVLRSGVPNVFSVGGDLGYFLRLIETQDRARLAEYARTAISVVHRNYIAHGLKGVTTVALLEGDALGGGFEQALSCDIVIAERHVKAAFPEVLFDMFPGMGGLSFLARRANRRVANELTRTGRQYTAQELLELGVIDQVVETGEGIDAVQSIVRQRMHQRQAHMAMDTVDRILRPVTLSELNDVVRLWVDAAVHLSERGQQWMRRLHRQQVSMYGGTLSLVPAASMQ